MTMIRTTYISRPFLDELDPDAGRDVPEPPIECNGLFCQQYERLLDATVNGFKARQGFADAAKGEK